MYVLDGKYSFTSFYSIASLLDLGKEISDFIIVAIDGEHLPDPDWMVNRFNDFTPTHIPQADSTWSAMFQLPYGALTSGGALSFLIQYKVTLYHSLTNSTKLPPAGAYSGIRLGAFCWLLSLTRPGLFQQYSMNSPSFWWNNNEMLTLETAFVKQHPTLSATNIFISAGALEGPAMISPVTEFANTLKAHYAGLPITSQIFESETHLSVVPAASSRTLKTFYIHSF